MNNSLSELTVIIVTFKTNINILQNCLNSIDQRVKVIIVENSEKFKNKTDIENQFKNIKILCSGSNLGMGAGNNFGLKKMATKYALILNPDIICEKNFFTNIEKYLSGKIDFAVMGGVYDKETKFKPAGLFNNESLDNVKFIKEHNLYEVDWVVGHTILLNLEKFPDKNIFDENYFLFFEETDLCKSAKKRNENIYMCPDLKIDHLGWKGSFAIDDKFKMESIKLRNWHYMWSFFYYNKKHYGYFFALIKSLGRLFRSSIKIIYYFITFNNEERTIYTYRFLGLLNSILFKNSYFRINFKD